MPWDDLVRPAGPRLDDVKPGDVLMFDGRARCMLRGPKVVRRDGDGDLYVTCGDGKHWLADETDASGRLIGWERG